MTKGIKKLIVKVGDLQQSLQCEEINKKVELVRGQVYWCKSGVFRFSYITKMPCPHNSEGCYHKVGYLHFNNNNGGMDDSYFANEDCFDSINYATEEEKAIFVKSEEANGKFWNDEKKDFLKLEDVYFEALCKDDFNKAYAACPSDLLSGYANFRIDYNIIMIGKAETLYNTKLERCDTKNMTMVGIEVFIKLLENYKV